MIIPKAIFPSIVASVLFLSPTLAGAAPAGDKDITVRVEQDGNAFVVALDMPIAANVDEVWDVLTDFDNMASILSNVTLSQIANRDGNRFEVVQKSSASIGLIRLSLDSVRQVDLTPKREIRSRLLKGEVKSSIFTTRIAEDGSGTRVTVAGKFIAGGLSAAALSPEAVQTQTRRQYQELRDEILRRKAKEPTPPCILAKNCKQGPA